MRMERTEPILPSRNLEETRAFFTRMGFTAWWDDPSQWGYQIFSRGHLVVHFFAESGLVPMENDSSCYWRVKDADRFYGEIVKLNLPKEGIPRLTEPVDLPWGMREFTIVDPSGNLVRVGHDINAESAYVPRNME